MTGREIITEALELRPTPRPAVGLIAGGEWVFHNAGYAFCEARQDPFAIADAFSQAFEILRPDLLWPGAGLLNYPAHCLGAPIEDSTTTTPALTGPALASLDELDKLDMGAALAHPIVQSMIQSTVLMADNIGYETALMQTQWGPFTMAARILGVEQLMTATVNDPDRVEELIDFCTEFIWAMCEAMLPHEGVLGINLSEPVASCDMISPDAFRRFAAPALAMLIQRTKKRGKYITMHICGDSTQLLDDVVELAPHGFSLESKVDLITAMEKLLGQVCVLGNLSPTGALLNGNGSAVRKEAASCLETWGASGGFILANGCDIPKEVPVNNLRAMMEFRHP